MNVHKWQLSDRYAKMLMESVNGINGTMLPLEVIMDNTLSLTAKGTLSIICSGKENEFSLAEIQRYADKNSTRSVRLAMEELEKSGFIVRVRKKMRGEIQYASVSCP